MSREDGCTGDEASRLEILDVHLNEQVCHSLYGREGREAYYEALEDVRKVEEEKQKLEKRIEHCNKLVNEVQKDWKKRVEAFKGLYFRDNDSFYGVCREGHDSVGIIDVIVIRPTQGRMGVGKSWISVDDNGNLPAWIVQTSKEAFKEQMIRAFRGMWGCLGGEDNNE